MGFILSMLSPLKSIFFNKYTLIGILLVGIIGYHYYIVNDLKNNLRITTQNYESLKITYNNNLVSLKSVQKDLKDSFKNSNIKTETYISEIQKLKSIIFELNKPKKYKTRIIIKKVKVPIIKEGKTMYITKCSDIKVKHLTKDDSNSSIIRIMSNIGN